MADFYDIEKSIANKMLYLKHRKDYNAIVSELAKLDEVIGEMENLNGHRHYMVDRIEKNIFDIVDRNDEVLLIRFSKFNRNLADLLMHHKMEKVMMRAIENKAVVMQKDSLGGNLGTIAIFEEMESVALKIAEMYPEAIIDKNIMDRTMGMYAARDGMDKVVLEIIKNKTALLQQDFEGVSIGMRTAVDHKMKNIALEILKDTDAPIQQDENDYNMGMFAAEYLNKEVYDMAKQNPIAVKQRNKDGKTMIDIAMEYGLESMIQTDESEMVGE